MCTWQWLHATVSSGGGASTGDEGGRWLMEDARLRQSQTPANTTSKTSKPFTALAPAQLP
jgi:hypothetical protein